MSLGKAFDAERIRVETAVGYGGPRTALFRDRSVRVDLEIAVRSSYKVENVEGLEFLFEDAEDRIRQ